MKFIAKFNKKPIAFIYYFVEAAMLIVRGWHASTMHAIVITYYMYISKIA